MLNSKAKGSRNERKSIRLLESAGYRCTRSAASLGEWDIIGIGPDDVILVQVKSNRWPSSAEMTALRNFKCSSCVRKVIHRWDDRAHLPRVMGL